MKNLIFLLLILLSLSLTLISQEDDKNTLNQRSNYFYLQRKFPTDSIPMHAFQSMVQGRDNLIQQNGLYMNFSNSWTSVGPKPGYYGELSSGRGVIVAIDPTRPIGGMTVYYGADNGGLWKSTNAFIDNPNDVIWTNITTDLHPSIPSPSGAIAIYPNPGQPYPIIYYGTGSCHGFGINYLGDGIYRTDNDGQTWTKWTGTNLPLATRVMKIAIDPYNPAHLLAALGNQWFQYGQTNCGLYVSNDAGYTWSRVAGTENLFCSDVQFSPNVQNLVYLTGPKPNEPPPPYGLLTGPGPGYKISTDGGVTWFMPLNNNIAIYSITVMTICKTVPNVMYVLTYGDSLGYNIKRIYKSTDHGYTFTLKLESIPDYYCYPDFYHSIEVSPINPDLVYFAAKYEYRTTNGGTNWNSVNGMHDDKHGLTFYPTTNPNDPNVNKMLFTCDGGIWRTLDGSSGVTPTYDNLNSTLNCIEFYKGGADPYKITNLIGASEDNGIQHRTSESLQWSSGEGGDAANICFSTRKAGNTIQMGCDNYGGWNDPIYATFDGGYGLIQSNFYSNYSDNTAWVMPMVHDPDILDNNPYGNFFTAKKEVWKSTNGGPHFDPISPILDPYYPIHNYPVEQLAVSQSNPNYIYASFWTSPNNNWPPQFEEWLFKTIDGGSNWTGSKITDLGLPNKDITNIQVDPVLNNEIFVTMSGFWGVGNYNGEHVFKSTDYGASWTALTGLGFCPANDLLINYKDCSTRQFFVATDIGVFVYDESIGHWNQLGADLPTVACGKLQLNKFSQKLRVFTLGRGCWEYDLASLSQTPKIYVKDYLYMSSYANTNSGNFLNVDYDIVVCSGGRLVIPDACTIQFAQNKGIIVQDGGQIMANNGNAITFTSQSGQWNGIEFDGTCQGLFTNCTFLNALIPVSVYAQANSPTIFYYDFESCHFTNGTVIVNNLNSSNQSIYFNNNCTFDGGGTFINGLNPAIALNYSDNVFISYCSTTNCSMGIDLSNSNSTINNCTFSYNSSISTGIAVDNSTNPDIKNNTISGFGTGIYLQNSSPRLLHNTFNSYTANDIALDCEYNSNPRLKPSSGPGGTIWDAGYNIFNASTNGGVGIYVNRANPNMDQGINFISAGYAYLEGTLNPAPLMYYYATQNCWDNNNVDPNKFRISNATVSYLPINCTPPWAGMLFTPGKENEYYENDIYMAGGTATEDPLLDPPPPIIIDEGHGHYDTIKVTSGILNLTQDELLYSQGVVQELNGNYTGALATYKQIVTSYKDSVTSVRAVIKMLPCTDKIQNDTGKYTSLENYYLGVVQANPNDTILRKVANELAHRVLVRKQQYPPAITNYETDIQNTTDSLEILCYQLNIVETYMLMQQGGNMPQFTGKYKELKPQNVQDGFRMIFDLTHHIKFQQKVKPLPTEFKISQNYPNPFNPTTRIDYQLPKAEKVVIKVYNILGQLVRELVNEKKEAGYYTIIFDGTNYASGVYFYRVEMGEYKQSKKMMMIK